MKRWSWCIDHQQVSQNSLFMFYYYRPPSIFPIQTSADTHCRTCCSYCTLAQPKLHFNCCRQRLLLEKSSEKQCIGSLDDLCKILKKTTFFQKQRNSLEAHISHFFSHRIMKTKKKELMFTVAYLHSKSTSFRQSSMHSCLDPTWPLLRICKMNYVVKYSVIW